MEEIVFGIPKWVKGKVLPVLKSSGNEAAINLCKKLVPFAASLCKPFINALLSQAKKNIPIFFNKITINNYTIMFF